MKCYKHQEGEQASLREKKDGCRDRQTQPTGSFWIELQDNSFWLLLFPKAGMLFTVIGQRLWNADRVWRKRLLSPEETFRARLQTLRGKVNRDALWGVLTNNVMIEHLWSSHTQLQYKLSFN